MRIKTGDLVYIKQTIALSIRHNNNIWLVLGKNVNTTDTFNGFLRIQNIHNGNRCQYNELMLMKIETEVIC